MAVSNVEIRVNANNAVAQLNRLNSVAKNTSGTFNGLKTAVASVGIGLFVKSAVQAGAASNQLALRLKLVTSEYGEYAEAQELVARAQKIFGLSSTEAAQGVSDIFSRLRPLGVSLADIESTFIGFNTVARLSGVSAAGASSAFYQLAQALGSGRLQGDEFRSISEQVPGLLIAVSEASGIASKDLREYASQGKLTSDIVIKALRNLEKEGADKIAKIVQESDIQKFKNFENAASDLSAAIGQQLLPAVTPLVDGATALIKAFGALPAPVQTGVVALLGAASAAAVLSTAMSTVNGLLVAFSGGTVVKAAIASLSVLGEKALAVAAGKYALAGAITAANTNITLMTVGLGALKLAMLTLPWVALAAGLVTLGKVTYDYYKRQADLNRLLTDTTVQSTELKDAIDKKGEALTKAAGKLEKLRESSITSKRAIEAQRRRVEALRQELESLKDRYEVRIALEIESSQIAAEVERRAKAAGGKAVGFDVLTPEQIREAIERAEGTFDPNKDKDTDKSGAERVDISERLLNLQNRLRDAQEAEQDHIAATLQLMVDRQRIAESELEPRERLNELDEAETRFRTTILGLDKQIADKAKKRANAEEKALQPLERQRELLEGKLAGNEEEVRIQHQIEDLREANKSLSEEEAENMVRTVHLLEDQVSEADKLKAKFEEIGATIKSGIVDGIMSAIDGSKSFSESLSGILRQLGQMFIQTGVSQAGQALKIPGFANGGSPAVGQLSMVGEKGPELFVPKTKGTIVPNHALGGSNIVVNVDASGSNVEGDGQQAKALGQAIGAAVQAEIVKQKMPGGLLS